VGVRELAARLLEEVAARAVSSFDSCVVWALLGGAGAYAIFVFSAAILGDGLCVYEDVELSLS